MQLKRSILFAVAGVLALVGQASHAAVIALVEAAININGTTSTLVETDGTVNAAPVGVNVGGFSTTTGLGTITATITGAGSHTVDLFVDHEIDEETNTFYNENGTATNTAATGQSWEIDEPGYVDGDIYENFEDSLLDMVIGTSIYGNTTFPDDVSMALGWDFNLTADQTAVISFLVSQTMPTSGFYLTHTDPDSQDSIYFSSSLDIRGTGQGVPVPATLLLLAAGALGIGGLARRRMW